MFAFPCSFVFGESVTISETKWNNQTITNVYVTIENQESGSLEHAIIISSGVIIGFVGFSSIFQFKNRENSAARKKIVFVIGIIIGIISTFHLLVILFVYHEMLMDLFYTLTIIITIGGFSLLVFLILHQIEWSEEMQNKEHKMFAEFEDIIRKAEKAQLDFDDIVKKVLEQFKAELKQSKNNSAI